MTKDSLAKKVANGETGVDDVRKINRLIWYILIGGILLGIGLDDILALLF